MQVEFKMQVNQLINYQEATTLLVVKNSQILHRNLVVAKREEVFQATLSEAESKDSKEIQMLKLKDQAPVVIQDLQVHKTYKQNLLQ